VPSAVVLHLAAGIIEADAEGLAASAQGGLASATT
jgi:hypothetical protein